MPQTSQVPGPSRTTVGCMGATQRPASSSVSTAPEASMRVRTVAVANMPGLRRRSELSTAMRTADGARPLVDHGLDEGDAALEDLAGVRLRP